MPCIAAAGPLTSPGGVFRLRGALLLPRLLFKLTVIMHVTCFSVAQLGASCQARGAMTTGKTWHPPSSEQGAVAAVHWDGVCYNPIMDCSLETVEN